jgi:hypothetical protein
MALDHPTIIPVRAEWERLRRRLRWIGLENSPIGSGWEGQTLPGIIDDRRNDEPFEKVFHSEHEHKLAYRQFAAIGWNVRFAPYPVVRIDQRR